MSPGWSGRWETRYRHREPPGIFAELRLPPPRRLDRFEKTNEMLLNFNNLSSVRMQQMNERFLHHTRTLVEMKKDLDSIFRRIRWETGWKRAGRWHWGAGWGVGVLKWGTSWSLGGGEKENLLGKGKSVIDTWREWGLEFWVSVILLWMGWAVLHWELLGVGTKCGILCAGRGGMGMESFSLGIFCVVHNCWRLRELWSSSAADPSAPHGLGLFSPPQDTQREVGKAVPRGFQQ